MEERNPMKAWLLAIALFALLVSGVGHLGAQPYGSPYYDPYFDAQYQQFVNYQNYLNWQQHLSFLQQVDPYYQLHLMHYQLYLSPYQPYQTYAPCCYVSAFTGLSPRRGWVPFGYPGFISPWGIPR
jgi:hypothetical protein